MRQLGLMQCIADNAFDLMQCIADIKGVLMQDHARLKISDVHQRCV